MRSNHSKQWRKEYHTLKVCTYCKGFVMQGGEGMMGFTLQNKFSKQGH